MKKFLLSLLGVLTLLPALALDFDYTYQDQTLNYTVLDEEEKTVSVSGHYQSEKIVVPSTVTFGNTQYSVTSIGENAFINCSTLTSVEIPNSVTQIGSWAFSGCSAMTSVAIPNSVKEIGNGAFAKCNNLKLAIISSQDVKFGTGTFPNALNVLVCPDELDLTTAELSPDVKVTTFPADDFLSFAMKDGNLLSNDGTTLVYCPLYSFTDYIIPDGVTTIKSGAFDLIDMAVRADDIVLLLNSITIPASLVEVEADVFKDIVSKRINFADWEKWYFEANLGNLESNPYRNEGEIYAGDLKITAPPAFKEDMTEIKDYINYGLEKYTGDLMLPPTLQRIGAYAFYNCSDITSVTIPNSVTSIGKSAFFNCSKLISITIPEAVKSIEDSAFSGCDQLLLATIQSHDIQLGQGLFSWDYAYGKGIRVIVCPEDAFNSFSCYGEKLKLIPYDPQSYAFVVDRTVLSDNGQTLVYTSGGSNYVIPDGVRTIKKDAFALTNKIWGYEDRIESLTVPSSLTLIEPDVFKELPVDKIIFEDWEAWYANATLGNLEANPYRNGAEIYAGDIKITSAPALKEGMTEIKDFINCGLKGYQGNVSLPSTLTRVGAYAFYNNKGLTQISLNEGLKEIGSYAFSDCHGLNSVVIPPSVASVGENAFHNCSGLLKSAYPSSVSNPFDNGLAISYPADGEIMEAGVIYGPDKNTIYFVPTSISGEFIIPNSVKSVGENAFSYCWDLKMVVSPKGLDLSKAGLYANVKVIYFDSDAPVSVLDGTVLADNGQTLIYAPLQNGDNYIIPDGVRTIKEGAFDVVNGYGMATLESMTIPASLEVIEADVFKNIAMSRVIFKDWEAWHSNATLGNLEANPYRNGAYVYAGD
ncbi:MAG: leucine-rich repeat domain-containing protein, partial [Muribaculaceae bacterium]|nr:leucine-rich repeat domain-containing protein [Muribaculaceae bacterium]